MDVVSCALDGPVQEGVGLFPGGVAAGAPSIELGLTELGEGAVVLGEPVQQGDRDGHLLFGPEEGSLGDGFRRAAEPALVVPDDVAADDVAVGWVGRALDRCSRPGTESAEQLVALRQRAVLDKQPADVGLRLLPAGDLVEQFVRELAGGRDGTQGLLDVGLSDPGDAAVRSSHRLESVGQRLQLLRDHAGGGVGQQVVDQVAERAAPASAFGAELGFGAAALAVEAEMLQP
ncbi:hypothetical protein [Kribbella sp. NPDC000426]|uniref:hypothetical protein n=1 Tax=Kribbella sp. NPDC000426 TaxID=3154255 RepID=UPI00331D80F5